MKKKITLLLAFLAITASSYALGSITIKGVPYVVDTLFHAKIGPGTTQTSLKMYQESDPKSQPLRVFYLTCDRTVPNIEFRTVKSKDKLWGSSTVASMAKSKTKEGQIYFCGVNGDFYATSGYIGTPTGSITVEGVPMKTSKSYKELGFEADGTPWIGVTSFSGSVKFGETSNDLAGSNVGRGGNELILYTPLFGGGTTNTNQYGTEVALELTEGEFKIGQTCKMKVIAAPEVGVGNMTIPITGYVLSGNGTSQIFLNTLSLGDVVEISCQLTVDGEVHNLINMSGGNPITVENGVTLDTEYQRGDACDRHPRTGVGFSKDKNKIIYMVVDGRSTISAGVSTSMLGDIIKYAGADKAMNWDGGGSSTLYTQALGVRNVCSDGTERAVGNAMFAVYTGEDKEEITEINFESWKGNISQYGKYTPVIYGYNDGGVLKNTNLQGVTLTCDPEIGVISADGKSFLATKKGTGLLYASYNGATAKLVIDVTEAKDVHMRLDQVINNGVDDYPIEVLATAGTTETVLDPSVLTWTSSDTNVATVTNGVIHGVSNGKATITGVLGDFEGTLPVSVEIADGAKMKADALDMSTWTISGAGCSNFVTTNEGDGVTISYTSATNRSPYMKLAKDFYLYSIPKSFEITFESNITITSVLAAVRPYAQTSQNYTINTTEPYNVVFDISTMVDNTKDMLYYPIQLSSLRFNFDKAAFVAGTENKLQIKSFVCNYDKFITSVSDPEMLSKLVVYPNPVKAGEQCMYYLNAESANVAIAVYSLDGKMVKSTEVKNAQAGNIAIPLEGLAPATYMVQIISNGKANTAKVIVL